MLDEPNLFLSKRYPLCEEILAFQGEPKAIDKFIKSKNTAVPIKDKIYFIYKAKEYKRYLSLKEQRIRDQSTKPIVYDKEQIPEALFQVWDNPQSFKLYVSIVDSWFKNESFYQKISYLDLTDLVSLYQCLSLEELEHSNLVLQTSKMGKEIRSLSDLKKAKTLAELTAEFNNGYPIYIWKLNKNPENKKELLEQEFVPLFKKYTNKEYLLSEIGESNKLLSFLSKTHQEQNVDPEIYRLFYREYLLSKKEYLENLGYLSDLEKNERLEKIIEEILNHRKLPLSSLLSDEDLTRKLGVQNQWIFYFYLTHYRHQEGSQFFDNQEKMHWLGFIEKEIKHQSWSQELVIQNLEKLLSDSLDLNSVNPCRNYFTLGFIGDQFGKEVAQAIYQNNPKVFKVSVVNTDDSIVDDFYDCYSKNYLVNEEKIKYQWVFILFYCEKHKNLQDLGQYLNKVAKSVELTEDNQKIIYNHIKNNVFGARDQEMDLDNLALAKLLIEEKTIQQKDCVIDFMFGKGASRVSIYDAHKFAYQFDIDKIDILKKQGLYQEEIIFDFFKKNLISFLKNCLTSKDNIKKCIYFLKKDNFLNSLVEEAIKEGTSPNLILYPNELSNESGLLHTKFLSLIEIAKHSPELFKFSLTNEQIKELVGQFDQKRIIRLSLSSLQFCFTQLKMDQVLLLDEKPLNLADKLIHHLISLNEGKDNFFGHDMKIECLECLLELKNEFNVLPHKTHLDRGWYQKSQEIVHNHHDTNPQNEIKLNNFIGYSILKSDAAQKIKAVEAENTQKTLL